MAETAPRHTYHPGKIRVWVGLKEKKTCFFTARRLRHQQQQSCLRDGNSLFPDAGASNAVLRCAQRVQRANAVDLAVGMKGIRSLQEKL